MSIQIRKTDYGRTLTFASQSPLLVKCLLRLTDCNGLDVLGSRCNWSDLRYLRDIPPLLAYTLRSFRILESFQGIESQSSLRSITLDNFTTKDKIEWTLFPHLEQVFTESEFINSALWNCRALSKLTIANCREAGWENISQLQSLQKLEVISGGPKSLEGLEIPSLQEIEIHHNRHFVGLGTNLKLSRIAKLTLNCRKLNDLRDFHQLDSLKVLTLLDCGTIDTLAPLLSLHNLEEVYLFGTKIGDGKFLELANKSSMKRFYFSDQKNGDVGLLEVLQKLQVPKSDWPLRFANPRKWKRITKSWSP